MKTTILITFFFFSIIYENFAQITLENNYPATSSNIRFQSVLLESAGSKYAVYDRALFQLKLYNLDHSIYKTITVNNPTTNLYDPVNITSSYDEIAYVKEGLFDTDSEVEFMLIYSTDGTGPSGSTRGVAIINEDGSIILNRVDAYPRFSTFAGSVTNSDCILNASDNTTKMLLVEPTGYNVYSLPGTLSCNPCGSVTGTAKVAGSSNTIALQNAPNPANSYTNIYYQLPEETQEADLILYNTQGIEIKRYRVDQMFDHLQISTEDLHAGTYYYSIVTEEGQTASKKMLILR